MSDVASLPTDEDIVRAVQSGDVGRFGVLVERYEPRIIRYVRRLLWGHDESLDVAQETFLKAYVNIQSFDVDRKFSSWLYRIAHNESVNAIKKNKREALPFFDPDVILPHPVAPETAECEAERRELKDALEKHMGNLPLKYREVLTLYYLEELDYREIADILQIPVSTVGVRILRGKQQLRALFDA